MKKLLQLIFVAAAIGFASGARSQNNGYRSEKNNNNYTNSIGLVLGTENGVSFKHFYKPTGAVELTLTSGYRAFVVTGLIEKHVQLFRADGLNLFFGGGGHIGQGGRVAYYRYTNNEDGDNFYVKKSIPSIGADGILGLEYKFLRAPFSVGADVKPFFDVFYPHYSWVEGAVNLRYVIN